MTRPVINISQIELKPRLGAFAPTGAAAERYDARIGRIGMRIGARQMGYNITAVPPGMRAFPFHSHRVNEEMFFVLHGTGEVRFGGATYPIGPGDFIACPAGGEETAHQIVNTGAEELRFLAVSTMRSPEVCDYPDSGKFGLYAEFADAAGGKPQQLRFVGRHTQGMDYWEGE